MNSYFGISLFFMVVIQKKSDVMQNWYLMWSANQTKKTEIYGIDFRPGWQVTKKLI